MLHRPGRELARLTPRNNEALLFDGLPWLERAQQEHDAFAEVLTANGVRVHYLTDLLTEALADEAARAACIHDATSGTRLGESMQSALAERLSSLDREELVEVLVAGLTRDELGHEEGLTSRLLPATAFVLAPLPNLLFTRDSSVWVGDTVAVTSLAMPARRRETSLTEAIYTYHPHFRDATHLYDRGLEHLEGGDVLLLGEGVVAVGTGERTTPAGVERLARQAFAAGVAHTVLAVPIEQRRATMHLDTICTMVDRDAMVMYPAAAHNLEAYAITAADPEAMTARAGSSSRLPRLSVQGPQPFLEAAARALDIRRMHVIDTGLDPVTAEREQWDDGNNTLAIGPRLAVAYERNAATNSRLQEAGIDVLTIPGSELGSGRGGPRCMSAPLARG